MKKHTILITAFLALCMMFAFVGCGSSDSSQTDGAGSDSAASEEQSEGSISGCEYECPATGFGFNLPEGMEITKGFIYTYDLGDVDYDSGVMMGWPIYTDITEEQYKNLTPETAADRNAGFSFHIVCVKDVKTADEAIDKLVSVMKKVEGDEITKEEIERYRGLEEIHTENGFMWLADKPKEKTKGIRKECQAEYSAFFDATNEIISNMKFFTPEVWQGAEEGADIVFETTDLDGNPVDSRSLFAQNKITMVNIWGTTCGPCIKEMPELEKLNKEWAKKGGAVVGLVDDVPLGNNAYLAEAQDIVKETGVTYINLRAWDGFDDVMSTVGTPTSYFVDSKGKIVGTPVLGANLKQYKEKMEEYLSQAE